MMKFIKSAFIISLQLSIIFIVIESQATESAAVATAATAISEEQIPLKMIAPDKTDDKNSSGQKAIMTIGILLTLAGVGYYGFKKFSFVNKPANSNMQIKILTQHYLGPKKSIAIIRVAGESILIGVTEQNISMIKSLSLLDDELPQVLPQNFSETMNQELTNQDIETDDFSFDGIRNNVSQKIKSMRNI